jgi:glutamate dehydrogenase/leucine dehydrogenase
LVLSFVTPSPHLLSSSPRDFVRFLRSAGIRRFYFVTDPGAGRLRVSHAALSAIADFLASERRDFLQHEGLFFQVGREHDVLHGAFIHRTVRGQAAGGVRYWRYARIEDYLRDGLRLAAGMTRKNALAGLWWGGGKGVIAQDPDLPVESRPVRASVYQEYGEFISSLRGCYVTAEDVGTRVADMAEIFSRTRFTTCIPPALGGSGNPSIATARGVVLGMEAALAFLGKGSLEGKTIAVEGLGNVGAALVGFLLERGVRRILASDLSAEAAARVRAAHPKAPIEARAIAPGDGSVLESECDILAPCATGAGLNARTIPRLRTRIVCGAANNQLEDPVEDDRRLAARGITYVPDFLVNRMGIVTCADEQAGYVLNDPLIERHLNRHWEFSIYQMTLKVLEAALSRGEPPAQVATALADELAAEPHPIFGHRGRHIIESLVSRGWHEEAWPPKDPA